MSPADGHAGGEDDGENGDLDWDDIVPDPGNIASSNGASSDLSSEGDAIAADMFQVVVEAAGCDALVEELDLFDDLEEEEDRAAFESDSEDCGDDGVPTEPEPAPASSASSSVPSLTQQCISYQDCIATLVHVRELSVLKQLLPDISIDHRWNVFHSLRSERIGKIGIILGKTLKAECCLHDKGADCCKMYLDVKGKFEWAQVEIMKWLAQGLSDSRQCHVAASKAVVLAWRSQS